MYLTTTGVVVAQLTRYGRQLLADNSANFRITQYQFSDEEINYGDFDGSSVDAANTKILGTPVLEPDTVGGVPSQRYGVLTAPTNTIQLSWIDIETADDPFVDGKQYLRVPRNVASVAINTDVFNSSNPYSFRVRTFYGFDTFYLLTASNFLEAGRIIPIAITQRGVFGQINRVGTQMTLVDTKPYGVPSTDTFESDQNQSQSRIEVHPVITPDTFVLNSFAGDTFSYVLHHVDLSQTLAFGAAGFHLTEQQIIDALSKYISNRISAGLAVGQGLNFIDQYGETGIAFGTLTIRGSDTGQLFTVETLLYSQSTLTKIITSALGLGA